MSCRWDSLAILMVMFCTAEALYVLHQKLLSFDEALYECGADGFLATMSSESEKDSILSSASTTLKSDGSFHFWVGLWKPVGKCAEEKSPLRGYIWTVDNRSDSEVSRWRKTPVITCTSERCGLLSVDIKDGKVTDWGWSDISCTKRYGFICKSRSLPANTQTKEPIRKPQPPTKFPHTPSTLPSLLSTLPQLPKDHGTHSLSTASSPTTSASQIPHSALDKYSIFIPVLIALLVLVVLVLVVLGIFKCCFRKKPNKAHSGKERGRPEETVDLKATDKDQNGSIA